VASRYAPLDHCLRRLHSLSRKRNRRKARKWFTNLVFWIAQVPDSIAVGKYPGIHMIRFVALSDTHRFHSNVAIPPGEVLLFAGDAVGNYGRHHDINAHFEEFLEWLAVQSCRFRHVFFIAGNHETLLDAWQTDATAALERLRQFLDKVANCTYLHNNSAVYRGLRLYGSPISVSRMETEGKRYYSRAFERVSEQRSASWSSLPEGLDLLMTHCPPQGRLCSPDVGDHLLSARLAQLRYPPKFHIFGHDHLHFGIISDENTTYMNVAQDECLRSDPGGGGCALFFDMEARDIDVSQ